MKIRILIVFCFMSVCLLGQSDGNKVQLPNIIPKSPEVKGFERYGEYPVSEYTGVPSISIPLYTIKLKDLEFPITLDYHATGVQVSQEATWVGLGWNLVAGGCISTIPIGTTDGPFTSFAQPDEWTKILNYSPNYTPTGDPRTFNEDGLRLWKFICSSEDPLLSKTPDNAILEGLRGSGERDIYNVSILGNTFKISIHPIDKRIIFNGEKNKFKIQKNAWLSWTITDENGYIYYFSDIESYTAPGTNATGTSTWYLTRIEYPGLLEPLLKINYVSSYPKYLPNISETISSYTPTYGSEATYLEDLITRTFSRNDSFKQLYISSIVSPMDSISFIRKNRIDIRDASALDQIVIYDRGTIKEVKRYKFEHDYFIGENRAANETSLDYVTKRLKLTKLYEQNGTQVKGLYQFGYTNTLLPYKTSFAQDLWGFYNGEGNLTKKKIHSIPSGDELLYAVNRTLIPDPVFESLNRRTMPKGFDNLRLANRGVDKNLIMAGMLKTITYPTGGKSEFEFEPHILNNYSYPSSNSIGISGMSVQKSIINNGNSSYSTPYVMFEVEKETKAKIQVYIVGKDYDITQMGAFSVGLTLVVGDGKTPISMRYGVLTDAQKKEFNQKKSVSIEEEVILPPGKVILTGSVLSGMPYQGYTLNNGVQATLRYTKEIDYTKLKKEESIGGGLRIKTITNYTDDNTISSVKNYTYPLGGKLIYPLYMADESSKRFPKGGTPTGSSGNTDSKLVGLLTSYNMYNYSSSGCGIVVGYDQVEARTISAIDQGSTGKIVSEFINIPSKSYYSEGSSFFYPAVKQYTNGKLSRKIVLDTAGDTLSIEKNAYSVSNFEYNYINVYVKDNFVGSRDVYSSNGSWGPCLTYNPYAYNNSFYIIVYPTNSYNVYLTKKDESTYFGAQKVNKSTNYEYDSLNYRMKKMTEIVGDKKKITEYKYTLNYGSGDFVYQVAMASLNMVGSPIEEFSTVNTTLIQSKKTDFFKFGSIIAPSAVSIKNGTGIYETRLKYENYDTFGNPRYITMNDATNIFYIWGYNYQYPIAEIKNATYAQVISIIPVATLEAIAKRKVPTSSDFSLVNSLRVNTAMKDAHVTTFIYKPLVGVTEITDPKGVVTSYKYDAFNRLKEAYIMEGNVKNVIQSYDYYYKK